MRYECELSNAHCDRSEMDLNECEHFLKANSTEMGSARTYMDEPAPNWPLLA